MARSIPKTKAGKERKMANVMGEFKSGDLQSSSGQKVTNPKQAIAIGLSQTGQSKPQSAKPAKPAKPLSTTDRLAKKIDQKIDARGR